MAFGAEIKRLLQAANISARKFADTVKIDASRLRKWMQKDLSPKHEDAKKIEDFFGIPLSKFAELEKLPASKKFKKIHLSPDLVDGETDREKNSSKNDSLNELTMLRKLYESEKAHNKILQSIIDRLLEKITQVNQKPE